MYSFPPFKLLFFLFLSRNTIRIPITWFTSSSFAFGFTNLQDNVTHLDQCQSGLVWGFTAANWLIGQIVVLWLNHLTILLAYGILSSMGSSDRPFNYEGFCFILKKHSSAHNHPPQPNKENNNRCLDYYLNYSWFISFNNSFSPKAKYLINKQNMVYSMHICNCQTSQHNNR